MKRNIFFTYYGEGDSETIQLGLDWHYRTATKWSNWSGLNVYLYFFRRVIHINFVNGSQAYANQFGRYGTSGKGWNWSLFPAKAEKNLLNSRGKKK